MIKMLLRRAQTLRDWMATHPWPRAHKNDLYYPQLIQLRILPLVMLPTDAANPPQDDPQIVRMVHLTFHIFYLEWDCFIGWDPADTLPPAQPFVANYEPMAFPVLFPTGIGHYLGPEQQNGATFEEAQWLMWALTRTADPELAKAINCVLVMLHKQKARHLGGGSVQVLSVDQPFERIPLGGV